MHECGGPKGHPSQAQNEWQLDSPYWIARTQITWARILHERGQEDSGNADAMIESALNTARRYGFGGLIEQAEGLT